MATDLEKLVVSLSADLTGYTRALAKAQGVTVSALKKLETDTQTSLNRVEGSWKAAGNAIAGFGKGLVIGGIAAAVAGIEELVRSSITSAAAIGDLSDKLGITSDKLQELQYGAVQANMGFDELETSLLKFSKALGQARNGQGDLLKTLEANGFDKAQIKAMSYAEALDTVANLVKNAANEQDALLIITQAFGKGGDEMLEFLRNGSEGLKGFATDAHNAGAVIDKELIQSAQAFDDAWSAALLSIKAKLGEFVLSALPLIQSFDKATSDAADNLGLWLGTLTKAQIAARTPAITPVGTASGPGKGDRGPVTKIFDPEVAAASKKADDEAARAAKQHADAIARVMKALELETDTIGKSNVQQAIATALSRADVDAKSKQGIAITALVQRNEMLKAVFDTSEFAAEQAAQKQTDYLDSLNQLAQAGLDSLEGWVTGAEKLSNVIMDLAKQLLQASINAALLGSGPMAGLFGTSGAGGGIFSKLISSFTGGGKNPFYAKGGQIASGQMGIVGEAGPELIMGPNRVVPMGRVSGGGGPQVQIIDQRSNAPAIQQKQGPGGNLQFIVRDAVNDTIGGGYADSSFSARFGASPKRTRR